MQIQPIYNPSLTGVASSTESLSAAPQSSATSRRSAPAATGSSNRSYDVRDLNQDGYVTALEEYLYTFMHPGETTSLNVLSHYNSRGDVSTRISGMPRLINISV
jgi:hypothetical protein